MISLGARTHEQRRYLHCGWLSQREWLDAKRGDGNPTVPRIIGAGMDEPGVAWATENKTTGEVFPNVCPGWAVRQPLIVEICQAYKAFDKGACAAFFPEIAHAVAEGVIELARSFDEFSRQKLTANARRAERQHG